MQGDYITDASVLERSLKMQQGRINRLEGGELKTAAQMGRADSYLVFASNKSPDNGLVVVGRSLCSDRAREVV